MWELGHTCPRPYHPSPNAWRLKGRSGGLCGVKRVGAPGSAIWVSEVTAIGLAIDIYVDQVVLLQLDSHRFDYFPITFLWTAELLSILQYIYTYKHIYIYLTCTCSIIQAVYWSWSQSPPRPNLSVTPRSAFWPSSTGREVQYMLKAKLGRHQNPGRKTWQVWNFSPSLPARCRQCMSLCMFRVDTEMKISLSLATGKCCFVCGF